MKQQAESADKKTIETLIDIVAEQKDALTKAAEKLATQEQQIQQMQDTLAVIAELIDGKTPPAIVFSAPQEDNRT